MGGNTKFIDSHKIPLLDVQNYSVGLKKTGNQSLVSSVSFSISKGEIFGIAGESGSGKTLLTLSMFGFHNAAQLMAGDVYFDDFSLLVLDLFQ